MRTPALAAAAFLGLATISPALASHGLDTPLVGKKLVIRTTGTHKLVFVAKHLAIDTPTPWTPGDPRCWTPGGGGASIRVNAGNGNEFTIVLPCEGWTSRASAGFGNPQYASDYLYRDRTGATCDKVLMKHGRLINVTCRGPQVDLLLDGTQSVIDLTIRTGNPAERTCAQFGPPPTDVVQDGSRGTYVAGHSPRPDQPCPSSPSGAFIDPAN